MSAEPSFTRRRAGPLVRLFLAVPPLLYRGPLADLLRSRCVMLLTTKGRRTGRRRTIGVSFMPLGDRFVVFSGWGISSNWYRNVRANPSVEISVGRRHMRATAHLVEDPERRRELMRQMQARSSGCGPPRLFRPLLALTGALDYDGEIRMAIGAGAALPVFELVPEAQDANSR